MQALLQSASIVFRTRPRFAKRRSRPSVRVRSASYDYNCPSMRVPVEWPARIAYENLWPLQNLRECTVDRSMRVQDGNQVFDRNEAQTPRRQP